MFSLGIRLQLGRGGSGIAVVDSWRGESKAGPNRRRVGIRRVRWWRWHYQPLKRKSSLRKTVYRELCWEEFSPFANARIEPRRGTVKANGGVGCRNH